MTLSKAQPFFTFLSYLNYVFKAKGRHGTHSPFVYQLIDQAILPGRKKRLKKIEQLRSSLKSDKTVLSFNDLKNGTELQRSISYIAKTSSSSAKFSSFLLQLANQLNTRNILETGTSLGLNTLYLAQSKAKEIHTIEGNRAIAEIAKKNFADFSCEKIRLHQEVLEDAFEHLVKNYQPEMIFLDADHRSRIIRYCLEVVTPYLEKIKVIIIHDIYWSRDMSKGWSEIKKSEKFPLTIDLFEAGLIFPNFDGEKQHFILKF